MNVITPAQHDRLTEVMLDPRLMTHGSLTAEVPSPLSFADVASTWAQIVREVGFDRWLEADGEFAGVLASPGINEIGLGDNTPPVVDQPCVLLVDSKNVVCSLCLKYRHSHLDDYTASLVLDETVRRATGEVPRRLRTVDEYVEWASSQNAEMRAYWSTAIDSLDGPTPLFGEHVGVTALTGTQLVELSPNVDNGITALAERFKCPRSWLLVLAWGVVVNKFRNSDMSAVGVRLDARGARFTDVAGVFDMTVPFVVSLEHCSSDDWLAVQVDRIRTLAENVHLTRQERNVACGRLGAADLFDTVVDVRDWDGVLLSAAQSAPMSLRLIDGYVEMVFDQKVVSTTEVTSIEQSVQSVLTLLTTGVDDMSAITLLRGGSLDTVLQHNATDHEYPGEVCLHQLFEEQVCRSPDRVAVTFEGKSLTYGELDARANALARRLHNRGIGQDDIVGLCAEPSLDLQVAILGILKAGAAYAPLDPYFPPDRLEYLSNDLDCPVVLAQRHLIGLLPGVTPLAIEDLLQDTDLTLPGPEVHVTKDNLAYVMYTSGSTGHPKGVLIQHGGVVNFLCWLRNRYELHPEESVLQWTAYSFDAAVWELFWPLSVGARAVIAPGRIHVDLRRFIQLIIENEIVALHFVPAMLQTFLSADEASACTSLRYIIASGEPISMNLLERFQARMDAQLVNFYGVTEVSIDSTSYTCPPAQEIDFVRSGVPNYNTQIYVLDAWMQPLPFGARGEIYIGGDSVTRGYLRRPGKTAENFVPDPFRGDGSRLYRTGDLAQLLPDGNLKFLGRNDHQVKIRGIRVELLEIAAEIEAFEGVREAIVVSTGSGAEQGIVAYVTTDEDGINMGELRTALLNTMPIYMVPHSFVALDEFPINSNGKVDRSKLPSPKSRHSMSGRLPVGTTEEAIASIWRRHLGVQQVAADADFFSVGGNSLLAALVIADIREHFSTDLSLREWLDASTIEKLAMAIDRKKDGSIVQAAMNEVLDEFGM